MSDHFLLKQHELGVLLSLKMWTRKDVIVKCLFISGDVEYRVFQYRRTNGKYKVKEQIIVYYLRVGT